MTTRRRDESGAVALLVALLCVVLFGCAALAVDLTSQSDERQQLHDTLDTAALSGAMLLPDGEAARLHAQQIVEDNDPEAAPAVVNFYCITGSTGTPPAVDSTFIPSACDPGDPPYTAANYAGLRCNASICAIPCVPSPNPSLSDVCNAIELTDEKSVPFGFANIFGISEGSTGSLSTVACKGGCGKAAPNPLDIAVIADRTSSMSTSAFNAVKSGVQGMLQVMDPSLDQVMFGMNSRSGASVPCVTRPAGGTTQGKWFPIESGGGSYLFNDYLSTTAPPALNNSSLLVRGMQCMTQSNGLGTWLASPIDAGVEMLNNDPKRNPLAKKAIIYMTDGEPNENQTRSRPGTNRNTAAPWGNTNGTSACNNALTAASDAKNADVVMVTIAYDVSGTRCNGGSGTLVTERLAAMAGPQPSADDGGDGPNGLPGGCSPSRADAIASENADGDFFFCAAQPSELASLFETAVVTLGTGSRLVWMP
jgi:Putative Flp pilus-assembly TadE/G-like